MVFAERFGRHYRRRRQARFIKDSGDAAWGGATLSFPRIQGADVCGTVVAVGDNAPDGLLGKRVLVDTWLRDWNDPLNRDKCRYFGSECNGGYADYTTVPVKQVHPIESALSDAELATFATSYITAENMLTRSQTKVGDTVLITGATGGVGSALIQLARRRSETCCNGGTGQVGYAKTNAGDIPLLARETDDLVGALKKLTGNDAVDVVADVVGGDMWPQFIAVLRQGGALCLFRRHCRPYG